MTSKPFDMKIEREIEANPSDDSLDPAIKNDPAHSTAHAFLEELKEFSEGLSDGLRMAVLLPGTGDHRLYVNRVTVRIPEVICISGVDSDGLAFSHTCNYRNLSVSLVSYRVS